MMRLTTTVKERLQEHRAIAAVLGLFIATQLYLVAQLWHKPPLWDTAIYIAMGKALFSGGSIGFWESYRPAVLPILTGLVWKLGLPVIGTTRLLSVVIAAGGAAATYIGVEHVYSREEAIYTAGILLGSWVFYSFTSNLLTGIPASFLVLGSLLLLQDERYIAAGLLASLGFLTRFPAALVGPAAVTYIIARGYRDGRLRDGIMDAAQYTGAFFSLVIPYLAANQVAFGAALEPFIRSIKISTPGRETYRYGLYYLIEAIKSNPFFVALPLGLAAIVNEREWEYGSILLAFAVFYGFFTYFPLKIPRYTLLFLPLMALLAARGITWVQDRGYVGSSRFTLVMVLALSAVLLGSFHVSQQQKTWINQDEQAFYEATADLNGLVPSNDPVIAAYGDLSYGALPPGYLEGQLEDFRGKAEYYAINSCAWYCTPSIENCEERIDSFEQTLADQYTKTFVRNGTSCRYTIYSTE